jgi:hypothetical protein
MAAPRQDALVPSTLPDDVADGLIGGLGRVLAIVGVIESSDVLLVRVLEAQLRQPQEDVEKMHAGTKLATSLFHLKILDLFSSFMDHRKSHVAAARRSLGEG